MAAKDKTPSSIPHTTIGHPTKPEKANMQVRSILWAAFAVLLPFEAALAQAINPITVQKIALAAVRTTVWGVVDLDPDCSVGGPVTVKIRKGPRHGKVEIEDENGFSGYQSSNSRFHCNKIQVPMKKIYYTADDDYDGNDKIELEAFTSRGAAWKASINVTVKK